MPNFLEVDAVHGRFEKLVVNDGAHIEFSIKVHAYIELRIFIEFQIKVHVYIFFSYLLYNWKITLQK